MSKEKIDEIAKILCQNGFCNLEDWNGCKLQVGEYCSVCIRMAERLYNAGYRKQSEGEWLEDGYYDNPCVCSNCGAEAQFVSKFNETFDYDWEENLKSTGYEEIREYIRTPFCPNCGAKMRKEDEGK